VEFYSGGGRALALARANLTNRPTRRAVEQMQTIASSGGEAATQTGSSAVMT
jgi:hypothetical protein